MTPLDPDENPGLLSSWVTTRADLNVAEQDNIDAAVAWTIRQRNSDLLTADFAVKLHNRMFGQMWAWAGTFRETEKNIGIAPHRIRQEIATLFDDVRYWVSDSTFCPDEICVRLHHRLVYVHSFPNGNGRHARLMADLLGGQLGIDVFTWDSASLQEVSELRRSYIAAIQAADAHDYDPLLLFVKS